MISILAEYENNFFTYNTISSDMWYKLIKDTQKEQKIYFDLENNESKKQQRSIKIIDKIDTPPTNEYVFNCELFSAGGDWEVPANYFRCQIIKGYLEDRTSYRNSYFIYIPKKTEGNYNLVWNDKSGVWCVPDNSYYKKGIDPEVNDRDCWKALDKYLRKMVEEYVEKKKQKIDNFNHPTEEKEAPDENITS